MIRDMLIGAILNNFVVTLFLCALVAWDAREQGRERAREDARRSAAREEADHLKVIAIDDFRRRHGRPA